MKRNLQSRRRELHFHAGGSFNDEADKGLGILRDSIRDQNDPIAEISGAILSVGAEFFGPVHVLSARVGQFVARLDLERREDATLELNQLAVQR